jgi:hypothetical protein
MSSRYQDALAVESTTFGYPESIPDLKSASFILRTSSRESALSVDCGPRSFRAYWKTRGTASGRLLALNVVATTKDQGLIFPSDCSGYSDFKWERNSGVAISVMGAILETDGSAKDSG